MGPTSYNRQQKGIEEWSDILISYKILSKANKIELNQGDIKSE